MRLAEKGALCVIALALLGNTMNAGQAQQIDRSGTCRLREADRFREGEIYAELSEDDGGTQESGDDPAPVVTAAPTAKPAATDEPVVTAAPTAVPAATATAVPAATATATAAPAATATAAPEATATAAPAATATAVPAATATAAPEVTATVAPAATKNQTGKTGKTGGTKATSTPAPTATPVPEQTQAAAEGILPTETPVSEETATPAPHDVVVSSLSETWIIVVGSAVVVLLGAVVGLLLSGKNKKAGGAGKKGKEKPVVKKAADTGKQRELIGMPDQGGTAARRSVSKAFSVSLTLTPLSGRPGEITFTLSSDRPNGITVGRDAKKSDRALRADDPTMSGRHAAFALRNGNVLLADAGSGNGTFVNGKKVTQPVVLHQQDEVFFGPHTGYKVQWTTIEK